MKSVKILFLTIWVCLNAHSAQGQSWSVGLQVGENFSKLTGETASDYNPGLSLGLNASHYLTENLVLRLELNWERKGASFDPPTIPDPDFVEEYHLDYLSLPLLLRYTTKGNKVRYTVGGGAAFDYLIKEKTFVIDGSAMDEISDFRRFDTELVLCGGTAIPIGKSLTLGFEVRTLIGLLKVDKAGGTASELGRNFSWGLIGGLNYYL